MPSLYTIAANRRLLRELDARHCTERDGKLAVPRGRRRRSTSSWKVTHPSIILTKVANFKRSHEIRQTSFGWVAVKRQVGWVGGWGGGCSCSGDHP
jgi:hypothetical protein